MTGIQQVLIARGRHQIVTLDGLARDADTGTSARYAVTTLGGAVLQRDLTRDEAYAWLDRLSSQEGGLTPGGSVDAPPPPLARATTRRR